MKTTVTLMPGDGIGPEVTAATVRVLEVAGAEIEWESYLAGAEAIARGASDPLPDDLLASRDVELPFRAHEVVLGVYVPEDDPFPPFPFLPFPLHPSPFTLHLTSSNLGFGK